MKTKTTFILFPAILFCSLMIIQLGCKKDENNDEEPFNCGESLIDTRDEQVYTTILIGEQCWMAENMNIGEMINGTEDMTDNGIIEKYCYDNDPVNCETYGGLYQWSEMMEFTTTPGVQGICPLGWHLPTDDEWKILEGTVDGQYPVGDTIWNNTGWRGHNAGNNLKSNAGWPQNTGTNLFGFSALPGGGLLEGVSEFYFLGEEGGFWSSTEKGTNAWRRMLAFHNDGINRGYYYKKIGYSIRCLQD
jgi:uncharacterized protein (TIGR02145 family)